MARISSLVPPTLLRSDLLLDPARPEHRSTRLKTISVLRLHKLATIHATSMVRFLGVLEAPLRAELGAKLRALLAFD